MSHQSNFRHTAIAVLACHLLFPRFSVAAAIGINNPSFEDITGVGLPLVCPVGPGCLYNTGPVPDWVTANAGQFQPGVQAGNLTYFNTVPDGIRVGYSNNGSLSQTVGPTVQYGAIYTLSVDQGVRKDFGDPGQISLRIGNNEFAVATGIPATPGNWSTYTAQYVGTAADVGKSITIVLSSPGAQGDWDKVGLDATAGTPCPGECLNNFLPKPAVAAQTLTLVLKGDVRNQINLAATADSAITNPFAYVDKNIFGGANTSTVTTTLDSDGNTDLTFTAGLHPILNSYSFNYGGQSNGQPHYGYQGFNNAQFNILSQTWSNLGANTALPSWSAPCPALNGPAIGFGVLFAEVTQGGQTEGQWLECPVDASTFSLVMMNPTAASETLSDVGFFLSPTNIPLELLNFGGTPPPDQQGTPFISLARYNGLTLNAGGSITISAVPEPSFALLFAGALLVVLSATKRRNSGSPDLQ